MANMNEEGARKAVQKFISDNQSTFVSGITHGGVAKSIYMIALTRFTPPVSPYHVNISCTRSRLRNTRNQSHVIVTDGVYYSMTIELADYIYSEPNENTVYETMTMDFLTVRDRIVNALAGEALSNGSLSNASGDIFKFDTEAADIIDVQNIEEFIVANIPVMYSAIRFVLIGC